MLCTRSFCQEAWCGLTGVIHRKCALVNPQMIYSGSSSIPGACHVAT